VTRSTGDVAAVGQPAVVSYRAEVKLSILYQFYHDFFRFGETGQHADSGKSSKKGQEELPHLVNTKLRLGPFTNDVQCTPVTRLYISQKVYEAMISDI